MDSQELQQLHKLQQLEIQLKAFKVKKTQQATVKE